MKPVLLIDFGSTNTKVTAVDLDAEIPPEAFAAVAEILSYIYELNASAEAKGQTE